MVNCTLDSGAESQPTTPMHERPRPDLQSCSPGEGRREEEEEERQNGCEPHRYGSTGGGLGKRAVELVGVAESKDAVSQLGEYCLHKVIRAKNAKQRQLLIGCMGSLGTS